jgi:S-(hydroxymethyl)glutathione dehydrogenase/alcohol dehydrogenase
MKTKAAVLLGAEKEWEVMDLELDPPGTGEVLVRFVASGLCHSDEHMRDGTLPVRFPIVGGHEGAGVVEQVGDGVTRVKAGDHIVCSFLPVCGHCRWCARGKSYLCDNGALILQGSMLDGTFRFHADGEDFGALDMLGSFSQYAVVADSSCVVVDNELDLEMAALLGCGVPTGWNSAVHAGMVRPGDTTVVIGAGGLGHYAIQGAKFAGAENLIVVDPLENKRRSSVEFGATATAADMAEAHEIVMQTTRGVGADQAIITMDVASSDVILAAFNLIAKGSTLVLTSASRPGDLNVTLPGLDLAMSAKRVQGTLYGLSNPFEDIPRLAKLHASGHLKLEETVTETYDLENINDGYHDMLAGKNIRGLLRHKH